MSNKNDEALASPDAIVQGKHWRLTVLTPGLVRVEHSPDGRFEDRASTFAINRSLLFPRFTAFRTDRGGVELVTANLRLTYDGKPFSPHGLRVEGLFAPIIGNGLDGPPEWRYPSANAGQASANDGLPGLGGGIITKTGISMIDDPHSMLFNEDGWFTTRKPGRKDIYLFCYGPNHREAIKAFHLISGAPPVLPRWALGNWWSKDYAYDQGEYLALMDKFDKEKIPIRPSGRAVVGQSAWTWDKELFPDHVDFLSQTHNRNLMVATTTRPGDGLRSGDAAYEKVCKALGRDPAQGLPVHFDPTDSRILEAYFTQILHPLENEGVDLMCLDWPQAHDWKDADVDPVWMLDQYHSRHSRRRRGRPSTCSQIAGLGSHRCAISFSEDTEIHWTALQSQPEWTASAAGNGFSWLAHAIGGAHGGIDDDVLYRRWVQFGLFSPILRLHTGWNTAIVREPWLRGLDCQKAVTNSLRFRHRLIPYLYTMNVRAALGEGPLVEPIYLDHPSDTYAYRNKNQYFLGSEMIACPITKPNTYVTNMGSVECWLPPGRYVDLFTGSVYDGDRVIKMHRPTSSIPVLVNAGSIIPLDNTDGTQNGAPIPTALELIVTVGLDGEFTIKEDNGTEANVDGIQFSNTPIKYEQESGRLIIGPTENPLIPERSWTVQLAAFPIGHIQDISLTVAGQSAPFKVEEDDKGVKVILARSAPAESQIVLQLGKGLRLKSPRLLTKVQEVVARAQIEHDTKWEILTVVKAELTRAVRVSRIAATDMDSEMRSAVMVRSRG